MTLKERFKERVLIQPLIDGARVLITIQKVNNLFVILAHVDFEFFDDAFCWKVGGDGDNGESLMYELDLLMELYDFEAKEKLS